MDPFEDLEELFDYNREGYFMDGKLWIHRAYQEQDMRVAQAQLYRDDVRDLMELTCGKMDVYMIVDALFLDMAVTILCKGRYEIFSTYRSCARGGTLFL